MTKGSANLRNNLALATLLTLCSNMPTHAASAQSSGHSPQFDAGCKQMQMKRFSDALSNMTEAIAVTPRDSLAFFRRGQCFYCLGKYQDAVTDFDHAIELENEVSTYYLWRGTAQAKLGNDKNAVRDYLKAMRLDQSLVAAYNAGQTARVAASKPPEKKNVAGELAAAPSSSETAASILHPDSGAKSGAARKSGTEAISLGYNANAVQDYAEAAKRASIRSTAYFRPGTVYSGICELSESGSPIGVKLGSDAEGTIAKRDGTDYFSLNGSTKEIHELETQIGEHPENASLYYEKGRLLQQLGWQEMAQTEFDRAVDLDRGNALYRLARAFLYHQEQKDELAKKEIDLAISLDPELPETISFGPPTQKAAASTDEESATTAAK